MLLFQTIFIGSVSIYFLNLLLKKLIKDYRLRKGKKMYHYIEYSIHGRTENTLDYGPLKNEVGIGLIKEVKAAGGTIIYHYMHGLHEVHQYIDHVNAKIRGKLPDIE